MQNQNPFQKEHTLLQSVTPVMRLQEGDDFDKWQETAYQKLHELLGIEMMQKAEDDSFHIEWQQEKDEYTEIRFTFASEPDYTVPCHLLLPKQISAPYRPVICLQGHSSGMHISLGRAKFENDHASISGGDRDFAIRAVKEGYAAIAMEQRYMGECGGHEASPGCLHGDASAALLLGRCAIGERVWDVMRLIDVLQKHFPALDTEQLMVLGNSGGGTTTFYSACMDKRIKCAIPSCSVCTYQDSIGAMHHCGCNYIPHIAEYFDMGDLAGLIAPRALVIVNGKEDSIFPKDGVNKTFEIAKRSFEHCGAAQQIRLVTGEEGHRFYADLAWPVIHELVGRS